MARPGAGLGATSGDRVAADDALADLYAAHWVSLVRLA